ncbi:MAG: hypothetical protein Q9227_005986 [Pyrenula ochraceoflavens]
MGSKRSRAAYETEISTQESPFVFYGTPLPPLDGQTRDDGSYVPIWQQEVTDDRGRKRLHGAFTGGFSAGYFNTVGSKEGWTPSSFTSSRSTRAKESKSQRQQRPEDFMDEEDVREAEESKTLATADGFEGLGSTDKDAIRRSGLMDLMRPAGESIGARLLQKMGWKTGQGIGPKVKRTAEGDDSGELHAFAPPDPPLISITRKSDHKGLGYEGEGRLEDRPSLSVPRSRSTVSHDDSDDEYSVKPASQGKTWNGKAQKPRPKGGFGVGVLNDIDSEDEDPYSIGPKIRYNKVVGGEKKAKKQMATGSAMSNPLLKSKPVFMSKRKMAQTDLRKCHDGRLPLSGFKLSDDAEAIATMSLADERFRPPQVPVGWVSSKSKGRNDVSGSNYLSTAEAAKNSTLDSKARANLLGEAPLPGKSVFDFLTPGARDRLATASGRSNLPEARGEKAPAGYELTDRERQKNLADLVPQLDPEIASQALHRAVGGWSPYSDDEIKRLRYRRFLEVRAGIRQGLPERASEMTQDDWISEMNEFARSAQVFRPVSGMMASRFTTSSALPSQTSDSPATIDSLLNKPIAKPSDPAIEAARVGMFGPMTRSVQDFYPTRLLCKRFNVKPPTNVSAEPGDEVAGSGPNKVQSMGPQFQSAGFQVSESEMQNAAGSGQQLALPPATEGLESISTPGDKAGDIDADRNDALEGQRPGEAVFKAIFGSDDEDED